MTDKKHVAVALKDIYKTYVDGSLEVPVLKNVNVEIKAGELVAIMGPSGSGKSTLMNLIGLLDRPTSGELWLDGEQVTLTMSDNKLAKLRANEIGFVFQSFNLLPRMSALSNVMLPAQYTNTSDPKNRAQQLLADLGLKTRGRHKPTELSGGEKQRVAIARALINDPEIILADEPTGNLDTKSGEGVLDILIKLAKSGKTVIIVTHDDRVAAKCDRIIRLLDGSIQENHGR